MKKLLLLIFLIPSLVFGQQNITINDLYEYKLKCYNDSSEVFYYIMCDWDCVKVYCDKESKPNQPLSLQCKSHWIHKEPTFDGFIMFIEKKYKR